MEPKTAFPLPLAIALMFLTDSPAIHAQEGPFFLGIEVAGSLTDFDHAKVTDNTRTEPNTISHGLVFHNRDSANDTTQSLGVFAGYRMPLDNEKLYVAVEVDFRDHHGDVWGFIAGKRNPDLERMEFPGNRWTQSGESWPDRLRYKTRQSWGVTFKLGGQPDFWTTMAGSDARLYLLAGVRRIDSEMRLDFVGCVNPVMTCASAEEFVVASQTVDFITTAWTAGVGLEKPLGSVVLQAELRYTHHETLNWTNLIDLTGRPGTELLVATDTEVDDVELGLRLLRYF